MLRANLRRHGAACVVFFAALLLCGCTQFPKDWPIKEMKLPPDSHKAEVPHRINDLRANLTQLDKLGKLMGPKPKWEYAFNNDGGWARVVQNFESQLTPLGYVAFDPGRGWSGAALLVSLTGATKLDEVAKIYTSPNSPYTVTILNVHNMATKLSEGADEEGDFVVDIAETGTTAK